MPRSTSAAWRRAASGTLERDLGRVGGVEAARPEAGRGDGGRGVPRLRHAQLGHLAQSRRSHGGQVGGRGERAERLVRADVARGLLAADVLLARLQGQHVALAAGGVAGGADEAAGHLAHRRHARRHQPDHGPPNAIGMPSGWPSAATMSAPYVPGGFEHRQAGWLDHRHELGADRMRRLAERRHRLQHAEGVRLLGNQAGDRVVERGGGAARIGLAALPLGEVGRDLDDLDARARAVGGEDVPHLGMDGGRDGDVGRDA